MTCFTGNNARGAKHSSSLAGDGRPNWLIEERNARILKLIDDFLLIDGTSGPTAAVNDLLVEFFANQNPEEPYTQQFVTETVMSATRLSNFIVKLGEERVQMVSLLNKF